VTRWQRVATDFIDVVTTRLLFAQHVTSTVDGVSVFAILAVAESEHVLTL
jgi:hypothetical protein